jgi:hypothetical protein
MYQFHTLRFVLSDSIDPSFALRASPCPEVGETGFTIAVLEFVEVDVPVITDPVDLISFPTERNESEVVAELDPDGAGISVLDEGSMEPVLFTLLGRPTFAAWDCSMVS